MNFKKNCMKLKIRKRNYCKPISVILIMETEGFVATSGGLGEGFGEGDPISYLNNKNTINNNFISKA